MTRYDFVVAGILLLVSGLLIEIVLEGRALDRSSIKGTAEYTEKYTAKGLRRWSRRAQVVCKEDAVLYIEHGIKPPDEPKANCDWVLFVYDNDGTVRIEDIR